MAHIVTAAAVQITIGARAQLLERGALVPEGADEEVLDRLEGEGMIAEYEAPVADETASATVLTQADIDAAVSAAVAEKDAELDAAKKELDAAKKVLATVQDEFEATKAAEKKPATPAKTTPSRG